VNNIIVCSIDERFVKVTEFFLETLQKNFPDYPQVRILHDDLTVDDVKRLEQYRHVQCVKQSQSAFSDAPLMECHAGKTSNQTFYRRFLIFTDLYKEFDNVIFMDTDLIVGGDLSEVFASKDLFIVRDSYEKHYGSESAVIKNREQFKTQLQADGIEIPAYGANAGFFVLPKRYRTAENYNMLISIAEAYKDGLIWADQSILNLWMAKLNIKANEDYKFNFQFRDLTIRHDLKSIRIFHLNALNNRIRILLMRSFLLLQKCPLGYLIFGCLCMLLKLYLSETLHPVRSLWQQRRKQRIKVGN